MARLHPPQPHSGGVKEGGYCNVHYNYRKILLIMQYIITIRRFISLLIITILNNMPLRHVLYVLQIVQINANIRPEQCILFFNLTCCPKYGEYYSHPTHFLTHKTTPSREICID